MSSLNVVNLCFVTDDGYVMPTCVALTSILKNKKPSTKYICYVLCKNVSEINKQYFLKMSSKKFVIKLIDLFGLEDFSNFHIDHVSATPTSIYKFFIPEILKDLDKVLFLDGDIIVKTDLAELYNTALKDFYAAAVKDCNSIKYRIFGGDYRYFNSGVMLLNLVKMRDDNTKDKMIEYRKKGLNRLMDQDAFNYVFGKSVLFLPFKYNTQLNIFMESLRGKRNFNMRRFKELWGISADNYENVLKESVVLHYASMKPWKQYDVFCSEPWLKYYFESPCFNSCFLRQNTYMSEVTNSKTYVVGYIMLFPFKLVKKIFYFPRNYVYRKFLKTFNKKDMG